MDIFDFAGCGVYADPLRAACNYWAIEQASLPYFLAQLSVESAGFTRVEENMNYHAQGLLNECNGRNGVSSLAMAQTVVDHGSTAIAEALYGVPWGAKLGNTQHGDGYTFRGRGLIQITGRWNYQHASSSCYGDDRLVNTPDLLSVANEAAHTAAWFWLSKNLDDLTDVVAITKAINGGSNALAERVAETARLESFIQS